MGDPGCVVVTGASSGIGAACAVMLAENGFYVFGGVRNADDGAVLEALAPGLIRAVLLDVCDEMSIRLAASSIASERGSRRLAGLVNNAGVNVPGPLEFLPLSELRRQLEVNVTGQVAVTQAFLSMIRESKGRIVFIGSTSGFLATPLQGAYCASKFAIEAIADSLRLELKPWGIEVSVVRPGAVKTPIWEKSMRDADSTVANAPAALDELYGPLIQEVTAYARQTYEKADAPAVVARDVLHALTAAQPRTRYCEGYSATAQRILSLLPDRLRDWALTKASVI